ncbi:MAG: glycosyltransferase family 2 protein [candidate division Zixibacteria bacterium HGW-Zixibacteria-1]|nr:MAG: glycosyltransferase family 2 protein [candidate division Zixibacteria bacterium HGW-Zixibacteria-1]
MEVWPKISVVIPVLNEEKCIAATIGYLLRQDYPRDKMEILVANGSSTDKTAEIVSSIAAEDSRVRLLDNPGNFSSSGRNIGIEYASGEIITFVDGHTYIADDQLIKNTALLMNEKGVSVLSRPQFLDTPDNDSFQQAVSLARKSIIGHGLDSTIYITEDKYVDPSSSGASYRKEVFDKIGRYDERMDAAEDVELNFRAARGGYKSFTSMKLAVFYYPRDSVRGLFRQMRRYGTGRFRLARKHPGSLSIGTLVPVFITFGIPLLGILSLFFEALRLPFYLTAGLYIFAVLLWSLIISVKNGIRHLSVLPVIYLTIYGGLGYGFVREMVFRLFRKKQ